MNFLKTEEINLHPAKKYQFISNDEVTLTKNTHYQGQHHYKNKYTVKDKEVFINVLNLETNKIEKHVFNNHSQYAKSNIKRRIDAYRNRDKSILNDFIFHHHYVSVFHAILNDNTKVVLLKRQELSLKDYDKPCDEDNLRFHYFYDCLFFKNDKFYLFINDKEDTYTNIDTIQSLFYRYKKQIVRCNINKTDFYHDSNHQLVFTIPYIFEYGKMFFAKNKNDKHLNTKLINASSSIENKQYVKYYKQNLFVTSYTSIYDIYHLNTGFNYKDMNLFIDSIFQSSTLIKEYFFDVLHVPNSQKFITDIYELVFYYKYPAFENVWHSYYSEELFNGYSFYKEIYKKQGKDLLINEYYHQFYYQSKKSMIAGFYKNISFKELQKNETIYSKKINQLLKDKFVFKYRNLHEYRTENESSNINEKNFIEDFPYLLFNLFTNTDNLQNFIKVLPDKIYTIKNISDAFNYCYIYLPMIYIQEKDFLKFDLFDASYQKSSYSEKRKDIKRKYKKMSKAKKYEESGVIGLSSNEVRELFTSTVFTQESLEKAMIKLYKKTIEQYNNNLSETLQSLETHISDVVSTLFKIHYIYQNQIYKKDLQIIFNKFFTCNFNSFDEMEKELYKLDAYLEEDRLKEKIPEKHYDYLSYDDFYFKQPEDGFQLKYVGDEMHHCVFTYFNDVKDKNTNEFIVVLYDKKKNTPKVCLEIIRENDIEKCIQAKCHYNEPVFKNKTYLSMVKDFCSKNNILMKTYDIEGNQ